MVYGPNTGMMRRMRKNPRGGQGGPGAGFTLAGGGWGNQRGNVVQPTGPGWGHGGMNGNAPRPHSFGPPVQIGGNPGQGGPPLPVQTHGVPPGGPDPYTLPPGFVIPPNVNGLYNFYSGEQGGTMSKNQWLVWNYGTPEQKAAMATSMGAGQPKPMYSTGADGTQTPNWGYQETSPGQFSAIGGQAGAQMRGTNADLPFDYQSRGELMRGAGPAVGTSASLPSTATSPGVPPAPPPAAFTTTPSYGTASTPGTTSTYGAGRARSLMDFTSPGVGFPKGGVGVTAYRPKNRNNKPGKKKNKSGNISFTSQGNKGGGGGGNANGGGGNDTGGGNKNKGGGKGGTQPGVVSNFLPESPESESARRQVEDQLAATLSQIGVAREQIAPMVNLMSARFNTDETNATNTLNEDAAERGIFNSGVRQTLQTRDIGTPIGRGRQDLANEASSQYSQLASDEGQAYLDYNQALMQILLSLASQQAANQPLALNQQGPRKRGRKNNGKK